MSVKLPFSPSCQPRKLGFDGDDDDDDDMDNLCTPQTYGMKCKSNININNKENERRAPETPLSTAKDSQYKEWLEYNGFLQLFRNSSNLSSVIKILRQYSQEMSGKVEQLIQEYNKLNSWKTEIGQPALECIDRYKIIEQELKSEHDTLTEEYNRKNLEYKQLEIQYKDLQNEINDVYLPKIKQYDHLMNQINSTQKQLKNVETENKKLKIENDKYKENIFELNKVNKKINDEIVWNKEYKKEYELKLNEQKSHIIELNDNLSILESENDKMRRQKQFNPNVLLSARKTGSKKFFKSRFTEKQQENRENRENGENKENDSNNLELEFECAAKQEMREKADDELPPQFLTNNITGFDWNFAMNEEEEDDDEDDEDDEDEEDEEEDNKKDTGIINGIQQISTKIDDMRDRQQMTLETVSEEVEKIRNSVNTMNELSESLKSLKIPKWQEMFEDHTKSINNSLSRTRSFSMDPDVSMQFMSKQIVNVEAINDKIDALSDYLRTLKIDQRIITVYRKIEKKIDEVHGNNEKLFGSFIFKQESQQTLIDNSLSAFRDLFENDFTEISGFISDLKEREKEGKHRSMSPIQPIDNNMETMISFNAGSSFKTINNPSNQQEEKERNYNELIDINCNRLNEMFMNEFVMILINNISIASENSFNHLFLIIIKIFNCLYDMKWQLIENNNNKIESIQCILTQYKSEIDNLFRDIFQKCINNVTKDLITNQINRVKLQSRIAKLTNKLQINNEKNQTLSKTQYNQIQQQLINKISIKQIYLPLAGCILFVFLIGIFIGNWFASSHKTSHTKHTFI